MEIKTISENSALTIQVIGRLDTTSAPDLENTVMEKTPGVTDLIFDLENLEYSSSAGLRVFLKAQKLMNRQGTMKMIHVSEPIMEIFEVTGFTDILTIE